MIRPHPQITGERFLAGVRIRKANTMRPALKKTVRVASALTILTASFGFVNVAAASAVSCTWSGCNGKNPESNGCATGATTVARDDLDYASISFVELRYSKTCHTVWSRVTGNDGTDGASVSGGYIDYYGKWHSQTYYTSPSNLRGWYTGAVSSDSDLRVWSPMISVHSYERFHFSGRGHTVHEWTNAIDGCPDSQC